MDTSGDSGSANSAAVLFSELFAAINMMMATFEPSKHRRSYALGLSSGYNKMVQDLIKIRNSEVTNNERKLADLRKELERAVARELIFESEGENQELITTTELELMVNESSKTLSQSQALVLLSENDKLKVDRAETFLNLSSKPRKSKANFDAVSYKKGKEDSKKLSLGNSIE
jgi:predicted O-linked N-acetylglucosamine transferase (SPINDLY family)